MSANALYYSAATETWHLATLDDTDSVDDLGPVVTPTVNLAAYGLREATAADGVHGSGYFTPTVEVGDGDYFARLVPVDYERLP